MSALGETFEAHEATWARHREACRVLSNPNVFIRDAGFEGIVAMGEAAIPLIIERYRSPESTLFWGAALTKITGLTDFGDGLVGDLRATREAWVTWFDQRSR